MTIEAKDIQEAVKALSDAVGTKNDLVEVVKILVWPAVLAWGLYAFRDPLSQFLRDIGRRITKLSVFHIEVELAAIASPSLSLSDFDFHGENPAGEASPSTVAELVTKVDSNAPPSDLIVDIESGRRWLLSRLFLFSYLLQRTEAIRSVVFVKSTEKRQRQFLGIAKPEKVYRTLGEKYPWLNAALADALTTSVLDNIASKDVRVFAQPLPKEVAQHIVYQFMANPLIQMTNDPPSPAEWEKLTSGPWEHTKWIDRRRFNADLLPILGDTDALWFVVSPETTNSERNNALLNRPVPFVALVNDRGELKRIVDRRAFLDQLAEHLARKMPAARSPNETDNKSSRPADSE